MEQINEYEIDEKVEFNMLILPILFYLIGGIYAMMIVVLFFSIGYLIIDSNMELNKEVREYKKASFFRVIFVFYIPFIMLFFITQ